MESIWTTLIPVAAILLLVTLAVLSRVLSARRTPANAPVRSVPIMTARELSFLKTLIQVVEGSGLMICPQVSLDSMLRTILKDPSSRQSYRARYKQKRCDFALVDSRARVMLVIEVDDASHDRAETIRTDAFRDGLLADAGIPTMRIPKGNLPTASSLRSSIRNDHPGLRIR